MKNLLFTFEDLSAKDKATKLASRNFSRAGANVVQQETTTSVKRSSGISYREMTLTFADSQQVVFRIKQSGDIFQVLLNGKVIPIKHQDDHAKAIEEVVQLMDSGRAKFQKAMAAVKVKAPPGVRTAAPKTEQVLVEKRDALKEAITSVREQIKKVSEILDAADADIADEDEEGDEDEVLDLESLEEGDGEDEDEDFDAEKEWSDYPDRDEDEDVLDGDFPGHPFRGNQYRKAHRSSGAAVSASIRAKHAEKSGNAKDTHRAHKSAYHAHASAAASGVSGGSEKYHKKMAKFHAKRAGITS